MALCFISSDRAGKGYGKNRVGIPFRVSVIRKSGVGFLRMGNQEFSFHKTVASILRPI